MLPNRERQEQVLAVRRESWTAAAGGNSTVPKGDTANSRPSSSVLRLYPKNIFLVLVVLEIRPQGKPSTTELHLEHRTLCTAMSIRALHTVLERQNNPNPKSTD